MTDLSNKALSELTVDGGTRPKAAKLPQATDAHRRQGRKLAEIHQMHLMDIARIARVLTRIEAGDAPPSKLADIVLSLEMADNFKTFGTLCGRECRVLTMHHDAEEHMVFPALETKGDEALRAVVARLREEHLVVHELLRRLERAAMTLMFEANEAQFKEAKAIFKRLEAVVRSHFGYEEVEIEEALGFYLGGI